MCGSMVDIQSPTTEIRRGKKKKEEETRMWASAQRDGRPASVQRRKVWLMPTTRVPCSNAAKTRNRLKFAGVPQTPEPISAVSGPKFAILWGHMEEVLLLKTLFSAGQYMPYLQRFSPTKLCNGVQMAIFLRRFCVLYFQRAACSNSDRHSKFALRPHHV